MTPIRRAAPLRTLSLVLALAAGAAHADQAPLRERLQARLQAARAAQLAPDGTNGAADERASAGALPPGASVLRDVAYGADPRQRFDVYLPRRPGGEGGMPAAVLFMVHGGAWRFGDKAMAAVVDNKVAHWVGRGYILVSVNYRMLPDAGPLLQARDVAAALAAAQQRAAGWGGDAGKFVLIGHSAGAHLVALLSASPRMAEAQGARRWLGTVSLESAAFDVERIMEQRHAPLYDQAFGTDPAFWRTVSPYAVLEADGPPLLAVCSSRRADSCAQAGRYAARAQALGMPAQVLPQGLTHLAINQTLGLDGAYTRAVDDFLRSVGAP